MEETIIYNGVEYALRRRFDGPDAAPARDVELEWVPTWVTSFDTWEKWYNQHESFRDINGNEVLGPEDEDEYWEIQDQCHRLYNEKYRYLYNQGIRYVINYLYAMDPDSQPSQESQETDVMSLESEEKPDDEYMSHLVNILNRLITTYIVEQENYDNPNIEKMIVYFEQFRDWEDAVMISQNYGVDLSTLLNDCIILQLEKIDDEEEKEKAEILNTLLKDMKLEYSMQNPKKRTIKRIPSPVPNNLRPIINQLTYLIRELPDLDNLNMKWIMSQLDLSMIPKTRRSKILINILSKDIANSIKNGDDINTEKLNSLFNNLQIQE